MPTPEELKAVKSRLKQEIKVAIEWDGRELPDRKQAYEVAREFGYLAPFDVVETAAQRTRAYLSDEAPPALKELEDGVQKLAKMIHDLTIKVAKHAEALNQPIDQIPDIYYRVVAAKFVEKNIESCVLVAPDLWRPEAVGV